MDEDDDVEIVSVKLPLQPSRNQRINQEIDLAQRLINSRIPVPFDYLQFYKQSKDAYVDVSESVIWSVWQRAMQNYQRRTENASTVNFPLIDLTETASQSNLPTAKPSTLGQESGTKPSSPFQMQLTNNRFPVPVALVQNSTICKQKASFQPCIEANGNTSLFNQNVLENMKEENLNTFLPISSFHEVFLPEQNEYPSLNNSTENICSTEEDPLGSSNEAQNKHSSIYCNTFNDSDSDSSDSKVTISSNSYTSQEHSLNRALEDSSGVCKGRELSCGSGSSKAISNAGVKAKIKISKTNIPKTVTEKQNRKRKGELTQITEKCQKYQKQLLTSKNQSKRSELLSETSNKHSSMYAMSSDSDNCSSESKSIIISCGSANRNASQKHTLNNVSDESSEECKGSMLLRCRGNRKDSLNAGIKAKIKKPKENLKKESKLREKEKRILSEMELRAFKEQQQKKIKNAKDQLKKKELQKVHDRLVEVLIPKYHKSKKKASKKK